MKNTIRTLVALIALVALPSAALAQAAPGSNQVVVTQQGGCVNVTVCPSPVATPAPLPPPPPPAPPAPPVVVPPPPPPAPPAPPAPACAPIPAPVYLPQLMAPPAPAALADPARTRLGVSGTAEVLGHGEWELLFRGMGAMIEVSVGLGTRFQLGFKTSPITYFIPGLGFKNGLYGLEVRAQLLRTERFKLTAAAEWTTVAGFHLLRGGLSMKVGTDRVAFHLGVGALALIAKNQTVYASDAMAGDCYEGCGSHESSTQAMGALTVNLGFEARMGRHAKFFFDFLAGGSPNHGDEGARVVAAIPGLRFHGQGVSFDLGLGVMSAAGLVLPAPVMNLAYRW